MTWLTWRQFRAQAIVAAACIAVLAALFLSSGRRLADLYAKSGLPGCRGSNCSQLAARFLTDAKLDPVNPILFFVGVGVLLLLPAILGAFWGAPLVTRELESGSFTLAWNQGVTRTRWMVVKLALLGLAAMTTAGLLSLLFTWWVSPVDQAGGFPDNQTQWSRMSPLMFADRGIAPVGWAALAFVVGVTAGVLIRRTIPAMAVTLALVVAVQILWPAAVRTHLSSALHTTSPVTVSELGDALVTHSGEMLMPANQAGRTALTGAWIIANRTVTPAGRVFVLPVVPACQSSSLGAPACDDWIVGQHLRQVVSYLPESDFWPLQGEEIAILLALAVGIGGLCTWRVRRLMT